MLIRFFSQASKARTKQEIHDRIHQLTEWIAIGKAGITHAKGTYPILGAFAAGPSVLVTMYQPSTSTVALTHLEAGSDVSQALTLLTSYFTPDDLQVDLATYRPKDNPSIEQLEGELPKFKQLKLRSIMDTSSLCIDSSDGTLHKGFEPQGTSLIRYVTSMEDSLRKKRHNPNLMSLIQLDYDGRAKESCAPVRDLRV